MISQLHFLLLRWRDLTLDESTAIANMRFLDLKPIQAKKSDLRIAITDLLKQTAHAAELPYPSSEARDTPNKLAFSILVEELIALEKTNSRKLSERMDHISAYRSELKQANSNLKRIRNAYSRQLEPGWRYIS